MLSKNSANGVQHREWGGEERGNRRGQGRGRAGEWRVRGSGSGARRRLSLAMTLAVAARACVWLGDHRHPCREDAKPPFANRL